MSIKLFCTPLIAFTAFIIAFTAFTIALPHPCLPPTQVRGDLPALPGQHLLASLWLCLGCMWLSLLRTQVRRDLGPLPAGFSVVP